MITYVGVRVIMPVDTSVTCDNCTYLWSLMADHLCQVRLRCSLSYNSRGPAKTINWWLCTSAKPPWVQTSD